MLASLFKLLVFFSVECNTTFKWLSQSHFQRVSLSFAYSHLLNALKYVFFSIWKTWWCLFGFLLLLEVFLFVCLFSRYAFISNDVQHHFPVLSVYISASISAQHWCWMWLTKISSLCCVATEHKMDMTFGSSKKSGYCSLGFRCYVDAYKAEWAKHNWYWIQWDYTNESFDQICSA